MLQKNEIFHPSKVLVRILLQRRTSFPSSDLTKPSALRYTTYSEEGRCVSMTKAELLQRCAQSEEERMVLARVLDKLDQCARQSIPTATQFLSPQEQQAVTALLNASNHPRHRFFGGYEGCQRTVCLFLPDWLEEDSALSEEDSPLAALETPLSSGAEVTHRDVLGSLMGLGLNRENIGDILLSPGKVQVLTLSHTLPILLSQWDRIGRYPVQLKSIPLNQLEVIPPEVTTIRDTVSSLRLDSVVASGFSLSRGKAADLISAGRVSLNHQPCVKNDRTVNEGDRISCRGLGLCVLQQVLGQSRKGRTMILLDRYQ